MRDRLRNSNYLPPVMINYTSEEHGATGYLLFLTVLWTPSRQESEGLHFLLSLSRYFPYHYLF